MNHGNDPSSSWQQVFIHFDVWEAAEHTAVAHPIGLLTRLGRPREQVSQ